MDINDDTPLRRDLAIAQFCEKNRSFSYRDVVFCFDKFRKPPLFKIISYSDYLIENTTPQMAKEKIERAKRVFADLIVAHPLISQKIHGMPCKFEFCCDTSKAGILVAREESGQVVWLASKKA